MRRHALFAAHRAIIGHWRAGEVEMDLLLAEQQRGAAFAHTLAAHAQHPLVPVDAAVEIGNRDVQMVDTLDLHGTSSASMRNSAMNRPPRPTASTASRTAFPAQAGING